MLPASPNEDAAADMQRDRQLLLGKLGFMPHQFAGGARRVTVEAAGAASREAVVAKVRGTRDCDRDTCAPHDALPRRE